jgi:hypothetical protein
VGLGGSRFGYHEQLYCWLIWLNDVKGILHKICPALCELPDRLLELSAHRLPSLPVGDIQFAFLFSKTTAFKSIAW